MKKITVAVIVLICTFAFASCKKKSSTPSLMGTWVFAGISGTYLDYSDDTDGSTTTYSFSNNKIISAMSESFSGVVSTSADTISVTTESWAFNNDGTYTISEVYNTGGPTNQTTTSIGVWDYLSNSKANNGFEFTGQTSQVLAYFVPASGNIYNIKSNDGNTLVLSIVNSESSTSSGYRYTTNILLTFKKQ